MQCWATSDNDRAVFQCLIHAGAAPGIRLVISDVDLILSKKPRLVHDAEEGHPFVDRDAGLVLQQPQLSKNHMLNDGLEKSVPAIVDAHLVQLLDKGWQAHRAPNILISQKGGRIGRTGCDGTKHVKRLVLQRHEPVVACTHILEDLDDLAVEDQA